MYQVLETAHQVARLSVSTRSDVPFREMAHYFQELSDEKQEKMSHLMNNQRKPENLPRTTSKSIYEEEKPVASYFQSDTRMVSTFLFNLSSLRQAFQSIYHMLLYIICIRWLHNSLCLLIWPIYVDLSSSVFFNS